MTGEIEGQEGKGVGDIWRAMMLIHKWLGVTKTKSIVSR